MRFLLHFIIVTIMALAALAGCRSRSHDPRLMAAADSIAADPKGAAALLGAIDPASLSADDRHYRDLLAIKAADKAYQTHTSDSLILSVLAWARDYGDDAILTEALYYTGRVYSDLGDYPTALRYFQDALDRLPPGNCDINFRANILTQTANILNRLGLYNQAIPYLKESIEIDYQLSDTFGITYDNQLLGAVYMHLNRFDEAEEIMLKAAQGANCMQDSDRAYIQAYRAAIKYLKGSNDSALLLIRGVPERAMAIGKDLCRAYASDIYLKAGIPDTAYYYARQLYLYGVPAYYISSRALLLQPELQSFSTTDTLLKYSREYIRHNNKLLKQNDAESSINQNSYYNYSIHERNSQKLTQANSRLHLILALSGLSIGVLICIVLLYQRNTARQKAKLQKAAFEIRQLNQQLSGQFNDHTLPSTMPEIKKQIYSEINTLIEVSKKADTEKKSISDSKAYSIIFGLLEADKVLSDDSPLWEQIISAVDEDFPDFRKNILRLTDGKIPPYLVPTCILIRVGLSSKQAAKLICRDPSTIFYRRSMVSKHLFAGQIKPNNLYEAIASL